MKVVVAEELETAELVAGVVVVPAADYIALHNHHTEHNTEHSMLPMLQHCPGPAYCPNLKKQSLLDLCFNRVISECLQFFEFQICHLPQETIHTVKTCRRL